MTDIITHLQDQLAFYKSNCYDIKSIEISLGFYTQFFIPYLKEWRDFGTSLNLSFGEVNILIGIPVTIFPDSNLWFKTNVVQSF